MAFFEIRGRYYPLSAIDHMVPGGTYHDGNKRPAKIYLKDGDEFGIETWDARIEAIVRDTLPCIPAAPGFRLLTFSYYPDSAEDPGPRVHNEPIIGWRVGPNNEPLVVDTDFTVMEDRHAVLDPSGTVHNWEQNWPSQSHWIDDMRRKADGAHARDKGAAGAP